MSDDEPALPSRLSREAAPELDAILGMPLRVLDAGFVRVVDYMGNDAAIVQAARVSYGTGTKHTSEDRALIRYLMRHDHTSPFEMCEIKLHVRVPMDCWRQWIRHRTASVNEYSTRYSVAIDRAQTTDADAWRSQSAANRQGSGAFLNPDVGLELTRGEERLQQDARAEYERRLTLGVAREQARKDLPLSTYTEAYWKIDLHNLLRFLRLRMDPHAQAEIRAYAEIIGAQIVSRWCPVTWSAFEDYALNALRLTHAEAAVVTAIVRTQFEEARRVCLENHFLKSDGVEPTREGVEFEGKLRLLGLSPPW